MVPVPTNTVKRGRKESEEAIWKLEDKDGIELTSCGAKTRKLGNG